MKIFSSGAGLAFAGFLTFSLVFAPSAFAATLVEPFPDVTTQNLHYNAVMYLRGKGVIDGYSDGTFKPDKVVNRAEALKIIWGAHCSSLDASGGILANCGGEVTASNFKDVGRNEWYTQFVDAAAMYGVVQGYSDGTFKPDQTVNLVENLKILMKADQQNVNVQVTANPYTDASKDEWYAPYLQVAKNKNLVTADASGNIFPAKGMTRGDLAEAMYRLHYLYENDMIVFPNVSTVTGHLVDFKTVKVGDKVGPFTVTATDIGPDMMNGSVSFSGEATVTGDFDYWQDDAMGGGRLFMDNFDQATANTLPNVIDRPGAETFSFDPNDAVLTAAFGPKGSKGRATIVIKDFQIVRFEGDGPGTHATLVKVVSKQVTHAPPVVNIQNFAFSPNKITVKAGEPVTWINKDSAVHNAEFTTPEGEVIKTPDLQQNESYSMTFVKGTYEYVCSYHPMMKGTLEVTE